jgi:Domain of unknown function (DUF5655)
MWTCPKCERVFDKAAQPHSCHSIPLEEHFKNKKLAKELFDHLVKEIDTKIGSCRIISIPCCIHLFGMYDFLALLPKKDRLEIRFALDRKLDTSRLKQYVPLSSKYFKNCLDIATIKEIDEELIGWLRRAYYLKDNKEGV